MSRNRSNIKLPNLNAPWIREMKKEISTVFKQDKRIRIFIVIGRYGGEGKTSLVDWYLIRSKKDESKSAQLIWNRNEKKIGIEWNPINKIIMFDFAANESVSLPIIKIAKKIAEGKVVIYKKKKEEIKITNDTKPIIIMFTNHPPSYQVRQNLKKKGKIFEIKNNMLCNFTCDKKDKN